VTLKRGCDFYLKKRVHFMNCAVGKIGGVLAGLLLVLNTYATEPETPEKKAAIFVRNRTENIPDQKLTGLEDLIVSQVADMGFRMISSDDVVKMVKSPVSENDQALDELLESSSSAVRLAQNIGADYILFASLTSFEDHSMILNRPDLGIHREVADYTLRASYKIVSAFAGEAISSGAVSSTQRIQQSGEFIESNNVLDVLLADIAVKLGEKIQKKGGTEVLARLPDQNAAMVDFYVSCSMQDLSIPEVVEDKDGNLTLGGNRYHLEPLSVTVELDGVVIGSAPGEFRAAPGLHTIRLSRQDFSSWERMINVTAGQKLNVPLTLSDEGREKWMEMSRFFSELKNNDRISEANAEMLKGFAQMLRQSRVRLDVDTIVNQTEPGRNPASFWSR
jgi:hypothetical protein